MLPIKLIPKLHPVTPQGRSQQIQRGSHFYHKAASHTLAGVCLARLGLVHKQSNSLRMRINLERSIG